MTAAEYQELLSDARDYAPRLRVQLGLPPPALRETAAAASGLVDAGLPTTDLVWVSLEDDCGFKSGGIVCETVGNLPASSLTLGSNKAMIQKPEGVVCV